MQDPSRAMFEDQEHGESGQTLLALQKVLKHACENSPFYGRRLSSIGLAPNDVTSIGDLRKIPLTSTADFVQHSLEFRADRQVHVYCSSGTTGKPKYTFFSRSDLDAAFARTAYGLTLAGVNSEDTVAVAQGFGIWMIGMDFAGAVERTGATLVPLGKGPSATYMLTVLAATRTNVIASSPSYIIRLAETAASRGYDLQNELHIKAISLAGEVVTPNHRAYIQSLWGTDAVFSCYGITECGTVAVECIAHRGLHLCSQDFICEVIDPATGEDRPAGQKGELVITTLNRTGMPMLRYRTGDLVDLAYEECDCGCKGRKLCVYGRLDEAVALEAGEKIWPYQIEGVLRSFPDVVSYQLVLQEISADSVWLEKQDELTLKVVLRRDCQDTDTAQLASRISAAMGEMSLDFSASVQATSKVVVQVVREEDLVRLPSEKVPRIIDMRRFVTGHPTFWEERSR